MGEMADMVLSGTMCQGCGAFLSDGADGPGYPGWCSGCVPAFRISQPKAKRPRTIPCPGCKRKFNSADAMKWHRKAKEH